jgi:4-aminobutyrate aminotransferase
LHVGQHLISRLKALQREYPVIGAVRGAGLFLGIEFVADPYVRLSSLPSSQPPHN